MHDIVTRYGLAVRRLGWYGEGPRFGSASAVLSLQKVVVCA